jgi:sugar O-acyltransferase (sialic acid O-acetyltransferase NeuD family)
MKDKIILVGGGGHCTSVIDVVETSGLFEIAGIVDLPEKVGSSILGYNIIATDDDLPDLARKFKNFCVTVGHIKSNALRKRLFSKLETLGVNFPVIVSPKAYVSKHSSIGSGTVVMHQAVVNANTTIGTCCIINTGCVIEHDVVIGDHCHVAPRSSVSGGCVVEMDCFVGSNSIVIPGVTIRRNALVAAGSVVITDVEEDSFYAGNPARLKKKNHG